LKLLKFFLGQFLAQKLGQLNKFKKSRTSN
jgi:hypothetical protein